MTTTTTKTDSQKRRDIMLHAVNLAGDAELALARLVSQLDLLGANPLFTENERASISGMMSTARTIRRTVVGINDTIKQIAIK